MGRSTTSTRGLALAGTTAVISGVSVYANSFGVADFSSPAVDTAAKNLVAAIALGIVTIALARRGAAQGARSPSSGLAARLRKWLGLGYVGVVGGGVAFVLFFDGLASTPPGSAAFLRDTLMIFVALLAWPILRERVHRLNLAALGVLIGGEIAIAGGVGTFGHGDGPVLVLASSVLWAIEAVVARWLLSETAPSTLATTRMGVGVVVLVCYLAVDGRLGQLLSLDLHQWGWALACGGLLTVYVATWFAALARARVLDVTSVLVGSAVVTTALEGLDGRAVPSLAIVGVVLIALGVATAIAAGRERVAS